MRDRRAAGTISPHGIDVARGPRFNQRCAAREDPGTRPDVQRFARPLTVERSALCSVFVDPALDATKWRADQAWRPAVITRTGCGGGNRSRQGADTQQVLASLLRTAQPRRLATTDVLTTLLRAPAPILSPHFYPTSAPVN